MADDNSKTLKLLKALFEDQPQLLHPVTLGDLQSQDKLFGNPVFQFGVGRTHAGKTTLGNLLFGENAMRSTGYQDCTDYIAHRRHPAAAPSAPGRHDWICQLIGPHRWSGAVVGQTGD